MGLFEKTEEEVDDIVKQLKLLTARFELIEKLETADKTKEANELLEKTKIELKALKNRIGYASKLIEVICKEGVCGLSERKKKSKKPRQK